MRRLEFYLAVVALMAAVLLSGFGIWAKLDLQQSTSAALIQKIDDWAKAREIADRQENTAALAAIASQVKAGLDKTDGVATAAKDLGDQNKKILDEIAPLIKQVQEVTQAHSATIRDVQKTAIRAEKAANNSAAASKKAIKVIQNPPKKKNIFGF